MIERALLDTDMASEILKGRNANVARRKVEYVAAYGRFSFTSVTVLEILFGLRRKTASVQLRDAEAIFASNEEIVPDASDYRLAAEIMGAVYHRGTPIGPYDPLIAACALNRDLVLATGNARHFGFIQDAGYPLRLEDWRLP